MPPSLASRSTFSGSLLVRSRIRRECSTGERYHRAMSGSIVRTLERLQETPIADGSRNSSIACDEQLFIYTSVPDEIEWFQQNLTTLCSSTCTNSMKTWQSSVNSACSGQAMRHAGQIMEPKMLPMIYNYGQELVCLKSRYTCRATPSVWTGS